MIQGGQENNQIIEQEEQSDINELDKDEIDNESQEDNDVDSNDAKAMVGKPKEEIKLRKLMKQKLQTTNIPDLEFEDVEGNTFKFNEFYDYHKFLGCGSFGFVVAAIDIQSGEDLALKIVDASNENSVNCLKKEGEILQQIPSNPNVIEFRHMKEFENYIILAIENARGGTLSDLLKERQQSQNLLTDEECSKIVKGILLGLKHIHRIDFVHRDLKPSNLVIGDKNNFESIKLVDFGLAIKYQSRQGLDENCGTLVYQAPEQMFGQSTYGKPVDIWALGLIMYEIIAGVHPLWIRGEDRMTYQDKIRNYKNLTFNSKFSSFAINLLEKLCHLKPSARYKVEQALSHPWITRNFEDKIPRTMFEENIFRYEIDSKMRNGLNLLLFLSIVKNHEQVQQEKLKHQEEQLQYIKQEEEIQALQNQQREKEELVKQLSILNQKSSDSLKNQETPQFPSSKAEDLKQLLDQQNFEYDDEDDERFLQEIISANNKKSISNQDFLISDQIIVKEPISASLTDNSRSLFNNTPNYQDMSVIESGNQSSKSSQSYSSSRKEEGKINYKYTNQVSEKYIGKPPLAIRDTSNNRTNSGLDQAQRTQKSFRITRGQAKKQVGGTSSTIQNNVISKKYLINKKLSPNKRKGEYSQNDIYNGQNDENEDNHRISSVDRIEEEKDPLLNKTRKNSSLSNPHRKTQLESQNQSEIDSQEDYTITPVHIENFNGSDFSTAMGNANSKCRKGGQSSQKKKHKHKSVKRQKSAIQALQNQKNFQMGSDSSKSKQNQQNSQNVQNSNLQVPIQSQSKIYQLKQSTKTFDLTQNNQKQNIKEYNENNNSSQITVSNLNQVKRVNSTARNPQLGQRKIITNETFDFIRHGPSLKDKINESSGGSPQRNTFIEQKPSHNLTRLFPKNTEDFRDEEQLQQNSLINIKNHKPQQPLSPFEQFLQSLMKQNEEQARQKQVQHPLSFMLQQQQQQQQSTSSQSQLENPIKKSNETLQRRPSLTNQLKILTSEKKDDNNNRVRSNRLTENLYSNISEAPIYGGNCTDDNIDNQRIFRNTSAMLNTVNKQPSSQSFISSSSSKQNIPASIVTYNIHNKRLHNQ